MEPCTPGIRRRYRSNTRGPGSRAGPPELCSGRLPARLPGRRPGQQVTLSLGFPPFREKVRPGTPLLKAVHVPGKKSFVRFGLASRPETLLHHPAHAVSNFLHTLLGVGLPCPDAAI